MVMASEKILWDTLQDWFYRRVGVAITPALKGVFEKAVEPAVVQSAVAAAGGPGPLADAFWVAIGKLPIGVALADAIGQDPTAFQKAWGEVTEGMQQAVQHLPQNPGEQQVKAQVKKQETALFGKQPAAPSAASAKAAAPETAPAKPADPIADVIRAAGLAVLADPAKEGQLVAETEARTLILRVRRARLRGL